MDDVLRLETVGDVRVVVLATPVVGAVNGATFTGGLEMALGCDFLLASERAVFADTHARVGVLPDSRSARRSSWRSAARAGSERCPW